MNQLDAVIKQIKGAKKTGDARIASALSLISLKLQMHENAIESEHFKEAVSLVHHANNDLIEIRESLKNDGYVKREELKEYIDRSDFEMALWCVASSILTAAAVLLAVHYG